MQNTFLWKKIWFMSVHTKFYIYMNKPMEFCLFFSYSFFPFLDGFDSQILESDLIQFQLSMYFLIYFFWYVLQVTTKKKKKLFLSLWFIAIGLLFEYQFLTFIFYFLVLEKFSDKKPSNSITKTQPKKKLEKQTDWLFLFS